MIHKHIFHFHLFCCTNSKTIPFSNWKNKFSLFLSHNFHRVLLFSSNNNFHNNKKLNSLIICMHMCDASNWLEKNFHINASKLFGAITLLYSLKSVQTIIWIFRFLRLARRYTIRFFFREKISRLYAEKKCDWTGTDSSNAQNCTEIVCAIWEFVFVYRISIRRYLLNTHNHFLEWNCLPRCACRYKWELFVRLKRDRRWCVVFILLLSTVFWAIVNGFG